MTKNYIDELAVWAKDHEKKMVTKRKDKSVVAFLAVRSNVKEAMEAGYALKTIWRHMHSTGRTPYRYETFLKHVHRYIKDAQNTSAKKPGQVSSESLKKIDQQGNGEISEALQKKDANPKKTVPPSVGGFSFNSKPKKEDLF